MNRRSFMMVLAAIPLMPVPVKAAPKLIEPKWVETKWTADFDGVHISGSDFSEITYIRSMRYLTVPMSDKSDDRLFDVFVDGRLGKLEHV